MSKEDTVKQEGIITGINPGGIFNVEVKSGKPPNETVRSVLARCSGKMKQFKIKLVLGDPVDIEFSPYDLNQGRITRRQPKKKKGE